MIKNFDKKNAKEFIFEGKINELPCVIKNLAINNLNMYVSLFPTGEKLYVLDYKNNTLTEIQDKIKASSSYKTNLSENKRTNEQNEVNNESLLANKLLSIEIYERGKFFIYEEKLPAWSKLISANQQSNTLKVLVDALSVMRSLENGDMNLAKTTLKHLSSTKEKSMEIQKIVALFAKSGPEFFEFVNSKTLTESDKIELNLLKNRNETFAEREQQDQTNGRK